MQRASREQAETLDARNAVLGESSAGNRQITAEEANELRRGAAREGVDAAAVLDFTRSLADLAADADDPQREEEEEKDADAELARETAIAAEVEQSAADEPDVDADQRREKKTATRKYLETNKKTSGMGDGDGPPEPGDAADGPVIANPEVDSVDGLPVVTVVPRKRKNALELDALLIAARDAGILPRYMRHRAETAIERLTTRNFTRLFHALNLCGGLLAKAFVLKALLAHRPCTVLVPFARILASFGRDDLAAAAPGPDAPDEPPVDSTVGHIRLFWDPVAALGVDEDWSRCLHEEPVLEPWSVPRWLRGVPRAPLDISIVALEMAIQGVIEPKGTADGGAGDGLAEAFEAEGAAYPSLRRWLLSITARADDRDGLLAARSVMMRARAEMSRPWRPPTGPSVHRPWS
jgi:hypothetical protein